jgi:glycosyltransferase involved in cell wall biosynthesis
LKPVVLQFIDSFHQGGSERQAIQLTRLLHESGRFKVRLASLSPEGSLRAAAEELHLGEIPSFPLNSFYDRNALVQLRRLMAYLRRERVEIVHTHDFYTNVIGMAAGSFARVPARIASMRETAGMRTGAQKSAQVVAYGLARHVVANSEAVRKKLIEQGIKETKVSVVYNGLDANRLVSNASRSESLSALGLPPETEDFRTSFVTIVANMRHEVKDYPMFLRAAQRIKVVIPDAAFLLAGEGELTESIRSLASELEIESSTFFLGRCEKIAELLNISDVCVLSSKAEGFSNSILEYMAAGRPVVATDVGGAKEAIIEGSTGYLVQSGDDKTMAERIISLLREPEKARAMGRQGRELVEERFSCTAQLQRTEELYDQLLQKQRKSGGRAQPSSE